MKVSDTLCIAEPNVSDVIKLRVDPVNKASLYP